MLLCFTKEKGQAVACPYSWVCVICGSENCGTKSVFCEQQQRPLKGPGALLASLAGTAVHRDRLGRPIPCLAECLRPVWCCGVFPKCRRRPSGRLCGENSAYVAPVVEPAAPLVGGGRSSWVAVLMVCRLYRLGRPNGLLCGCCQTRKRAAQLSLPSWVVFALPSVGVVRHHRKAQFPP